MAREVGEVLQHGLVHEAGAPAPAVFGQGIGDHRHVAQVRHPGELCLDPGALVQIGRAAATPVQRRGARDALELHVLDDGLDGGETGARCQQDQWQLAVFTQEEAAVGAFDAQDVFFLHRAEHVVGELAPRHVAQVQFEAGLRGLGVGRVGHGVAAALAVAQQELHILASVVLEGVAGGQLQAHHDHIGRNPLQRVHAHRHFLDGEGAGLGDLARFEHHVVLCHAAAGQHVAGGFFFGAQGFGLVRPVDHVAAEQLAFAGAAGAVLAAVGQADALTDAGGEDGFFGEGFERASTGLDGDGECHTGGSG